MVVVDLNVHKTPRWFLFLYRREVTWDSNSSSSYSIKLLITWEDMRGCCALHTTRETGSLQLLLPLLDVRHTLAPFLTRHTRGEPGFNATPSLHCTPTGLPMSQCPKICPGVYWIMSALGGQLGGSLEKPFQTFTVCCIAQYNDMRNSVIPESPFTVNSHSGVRQRNEHTS